MLSSCRCSLKNRLVIIPADLELSCAKPNAYLYWQWAFESPQNVKLLVRQELGEDNAPQVCLLWLCCTRQVVHVLFMCLNAALRVWGASGPSLCLHL